LKAVEINFVKKTVRIFAYVPIAILEKILKTQRTSIDGK